ncbi:TetR/AcrR family transcriptional regulator [Streptomyces cocklensis]|jgi:AcrR family transcriptional regulator|uniref:Transcriptional regulator, TetR family n=1 Tax=Actinacidiphila cocklensis TaxID=887465 RepID=A0A9W4DR67_9ACTN|nr:TetR/AcrR family transcriptional regulator [Actinacidiphila cocklensis]MDD1059321.1 TetR/AcrR family transcriptional regulator [Actinacidiphila cocklensis]WSX73175.1 TetR/AcrR family transcriptional regulator [Streptomyces sp. NBC_00899]WSX80759.1 TetR/AcrR family transcriptional regulator [Streptomyces sp. NBC_00899]CAG6392528.1 Transcriptional regulator, TetR family [Actinacidiphila cocklensis]
MGAIRGARERARAEITAAIKEEAARQLGTHGPAGLSLRAVARELGMASSALYRYFPSRDDLLTALIIDAYDAVGAAAEHELAMLDRRQPAAQPVERWVAVCRAARDWAVGHPQEYALIYGSPVPGYSAPQDTVGPASRVGLALVSVVRDAHTAGLLGEPAGRPLAGPVRADAGRLAAELAPELPIRVIAALVAAWAQVFGIVSFEVFGQFNRVVEARSEFFEQAAVALAAQVGLRTDGGARDGAIAAGASAGSAGRGAGGVLPAK